MPAVFDEPVVCPIQIGRDDQVDRLRRVAAGVAAGSGQTVLVAGEAGIGKSRLVREFAERLGRDGWVVQRGTCFERDRLLPYAPLLDGLRALLAILPPAQLERCLAPALPDLARLLPELGHQPAEATSDPEQEKHRIFSALAAVFSCLAASQPLLLVVEDLHWADETSLELLAVLARRIPREPILLLATYRDDEVGGGLGYLLNELDRSRLAVELRLTRLGRDEVAAMLRAIFGLDRPVHHQFLQAIYALTEGNPFFIEELLRSLVAAGDVADVDGSWDRTAVNEVRLPRTVHDAERAGERADDLYAPAAAVEHYARAMEAARRQAMPVPPRLHRARGLAYERLGTFDLAWADHEAALVAARVAGDRHAEWQALLDLGFLWAGRAYEQTRAYFAEALGLARALDDPPALARSLNRVGNWHVNVEQPAEGERHHREALAIFEHLDDRRGIAETLDLLGLAAYMRGNLVEAVGYLDRAIALFRLGIAAPSRRVLRRGPGGLTAREQKIAALIAQGHSNRAMAERLVLSERTVEDHVSRMLRKLGFSSRAQIAVWATQQGLARSGPV